MGSIIERIDQFRLKKGLKQREISDAMGIKQPQYGKLMRGDNKVSAEHLSSLYAYFGDEIDLNWILSGENNPLTVVKVEDTAKDIVLMPEQVTMGKEDDLYHLIRNDNADLALNYHQEIKLRKACKKMIIENPGAGLPELVIAGRVFLKHLVQYPELEI